MVVAVLAPYDVRSRATEQSVAANAPEQSVVVTAATKQVASGLAAELVIASQGADLFGAGSTDQPVPYERAEDQHGLAAGETVQRRPLEVKGEMVPTRAASDRVRAPVRINRDDVIATAGVVDVSAVVKDPDNVLARSAVDRIVAEAWQDDIVASGGEQVVVA